MRPFQQSQQLHMPWTCEYGAEFASILRRQMFGTLSCTDKADMLYVKHILVSAERLLLENCTVEPLSPFHQTMLDEQDQRKVTVVMPPCSVVELYKHGMHILPLWQSLIKTNC